MVAVGVAVGGAGGGGGVVVVAAAAAAVALLLVLWYAVAASARCSLLSSWLVWQRAEKENVSFHVLRVTHKRLMR